MRSKIFPQERKIISDVLKEIETHSKKSASLLVIDTKNVADPALASTIRTLHQQGKYEFLSFTERLVKTAEALTVSQLRRMLFSTLNKS